MVLKILLLTVVAAALVAATVFVVSAGRFRALADDLAARVATGPSIAEVDAVEAGSPEPIRARALFNGAGVVDTLRAVRLTQEAEFRRTPDAAWGAMPATQHMGLGTAAFVWNARAPGPVLPSFMVIDAYVGGAGLLRANLLGAIPVADATGPVVDRAEAMRYLAELPWAPDAILGNPEVSWTETEDGAFEAALETPSGRAVVHFTLDADGDFAEMVAMRPDTRPDGTEFAREWRGRYEDYTWIGGRRIPASGEVGYVEDGEYWAYWRGRITGLELLG